MGSATGDATINGQRNNALMWVSQRLPPQRTPQGSGRLSSLRRRHFPGGSILQLRPIDRLPLPEPCPVLLDQDAVGAAGNGRLVDLRQPAGVLAEDLRMV